MRGCAWDHRGVTGHLYVVGTPIGNLGDLSERARQTLASVDLVAAEDTRRTGRLLAHVGVKVRMLSLFEGNERQRVDELVERLGEGAKVALVSDAGMPAVSDPGFRLLRAAVEAGIAVSVVPGPSAVTAALVVSGLPADRWVFEGFLPRRPAERRARLRALAHDPRTVVLFESPLRVVSLLRDALVELGDRRAAVARELTKLHEEVLRGRVSEVLASLLEAEPRGEIVVVIEGAEPPETVLAEMVDEARRLVADGMRKREAAAAVARRSGGSANEIYRSLVVSDPETD
jgi:16S rRNA (cytidine1402-2'-O)-methyltransferase